MSREKQIEEMALVMCTDCATYTKGCKHHPCDAVLDNAATLYNAGYRKQSVGEWISVEERLPQECTQVIVCDEDWTVGEAFYYKEDRFEWIDSEKLAFVTHWMPLPEPPKGE